MTKTPHIRIYTDGACHGNPGPGGWAALLRSGRHEKTISGGERSTTNNRMELTAAVKSLKSLTAASRIDFYTDSEYLRRGITEWMPNWKARGWKRKGGKLKNVDLWKALDAAVQMHRIKWHWVKGHAGHRENEIVDRLARKESRRYLK